MYGAFFSAHRPFQTSSAKKQTTKLNTVLIYILCDKDNGIVADEAKGKGTWIGLQINGDQDYHWTDDTNLDYQNWKEGGMLLLKLIRFCSFELGSSSYFLTEEPTSCFSYILNYFARFFGRTSMHKHIAHIFRTRTLLISAHPNTHICKRLHINSRKCAN